MEVGSGPGGEPTSAGGWVAPESGVETPTPGRPEVETAFAPQPHADGVDPPIPLRPMTYADILDGSFRVIKRRPKTVITIAAVIVVPVQFLSAYAQRSSLSNVGNLLSGFANPSGLNRAGTSGTDLLLLFLASLLSWLMLFFLGGAIGRLVTAWYTGVDISAGTALGAAFRRSGALIAAWLILIPVKLVSALACYFGLVFVIPLLSLTAPAIVVEGIGPIAGAKRSWQLVARRLWPAIGITLLATLVQWILRQVLAVIPTLIAAALPDPLNWILLAVSNSLITLITASALVAASVLLYLDLRVRTEGLDLELGATDAFAVD